MHSNLIFNEYLFHVIIETLYKTHHMSPRGRRKHNTLLVWTSLLSYCFDFNYHHEAAISSLHVIKYLSATLWFSYFPIHIEKRHTFNPQTSQVELNDEKD